MPKKLRFYLNNPSNEQDSKVYKLIKKLTLNRLIQSNLSVDVSFEDGTFIFLINPDVLNKIQQLKPEQCIVKIPYQKELVQELVWYGFTFTTRYNPRQNDFKTLDNYQDIIQTAISLDGDTFNYISKNSLENLPKNIFTKIIQTHHSLVQVTLEHFRAKIEKGFVMISYALSIIISGGGSAGLISQDNLILTLLSPVLFFGGSLILNRIQRIFQPYLIRWLWKQLMKPKARSWVIKLIKW